MRQIQIFGDSILKGVWYDEEEDRYRLCREKLSAAGAEIINRARMGSTIEQGLDFIERCLPQISPGTAAILEFGGNDCNFNWAEIAERPFEEHGCAVPPQRFETLYDEAVKKLKSAGACVIVSTLPPISSTRFFDFLSRGLDRSAIMLWLKDRGRLALWQKDYSDIARKVAEKNGCPVLDLRAAAKRAGWEDLICADGLHPSEEGHSLLRLAVEEYICDML